MCVSVVIALIFSITFIALSKPAATSDMIFSSEGVGNTIMPEAIPLSTNLSVEIQNVVVDHAFRITPMSYLVLQRISPVARV